MGGPTSQEANKPGGIDTLEASVYGLPQLGSYSLWLEQSQAAARRDAGALELGLKSHLQLPSGATLLVGERGMKWGRAWLDVTFEVDGIFFGLALKNYHEKKPVAYVKLGAIALLRWGSFGAWRRALQILGELGVEVQRNVLSRVDLFVDHFGELGQFIQAVLADCYVTRGDDEAFWRKRRCWNGYYSNTANCKLRVYDKLLELATNHAETKHEMLIASRWGGQQPVAVTRYEFQLRREWLADKFAIKTVEEFFASCGLVAEYLVGEWFRLTASTVDRANNHQSRVAVAPLWETIQRMFADVFGELREQREQPTVARPEAAHLSRTAVGCFLTLAALSGINCENPQQLAGDLVKLLYRSIPTDLLRRFDERRAKLSNFFAGAKLLDDIPF